MPAPADPPAVPYSEDWARVQALPTRDPSLEALRARGEALSDELTPQLKIAKPLHPEMRLKWVQALALWEIFQGRGAYLGIPVGGGKTLISWLAAYILDAERPIVIIPEGLFSKTTKEFHKIAQTWVAPKHPPVLVGTKCLQREENVDYLQRMFGGLGPDFVFIDECDLMRNTDAATPKRLDRLKLESLGGEIGYEDPLPEEAADLDDCAPGVAEAVIEWCQARGIPFVCATGTGTRFSILDMRHVLLWSR
jgi:hypothetical protein